LKNKEALEYFDYEISGSLKAAEYLDEHGLFVGNHQNNINKEIKLLAEILCS
jgi:CDP-6-deoxy-D-xylo-4-hexulose-3-dehydrase